ncbi:MAG: hypothetical protein ACHQ52_10840 [Candidatus Eisenbacteria bacterium]
MNVSYIVPLQLAWSRMVRMLFRPFRIKSWFVLGFAAFLSEYLSWGYSGSRSSYQRHGAAIPQEGLRRVVEFLRNPLAMTVVLWLLLCALAVFILFMWISSRGKFIFLENVVHEQAGIVEPWRRFKRLGNSLFAWRLGFSIVCLLLVGGMVLPFFAAIATLVAEDAFRPAHLLVLLPLVAMLVPFGIVVGYTLLFLNSFVVPMMYRHDLGALAAWRRFLDLFRQHAGSFVVFGLFAFVLTVVVGAALFAFGMSTCCIGFLLLGLPYIGSVLLLPVEITARALGPEFLAQFGPSHIVLVAYAPPDPSGRPAGS